MNSTIDYSMCLQYDSITLALYKDTLVVSVTMAENFSYTCTKHTSDYDFTEQTRFKTSERYSNNKAFPISIYNDTIAVGSNDGFTFSRPFLEQAIIINISKSYDYNIDKLKNIGSSIFDD